MKVILNLSFIRGPLRVQFVSLMLIIITDLHDKPHQKESITAYYYKEYI